MPENTANVLLFMHYFVLYILQELKVYLKVHNFKKKYFAMKLAILILVYDIKKQNLIYTLSIYLN